jgi:hypothetical protein
MGRSIQRRSRSSSSTRNSHENWDRGSLNAARVTCRKRIWQQRITGLASIVPADAAGWRDADPGNRSFDDRSRLGPNGPRSHSEKSYEFPTLYIRVGDRGVDEFWDGGWRGRDHPIILDRRRRSTLTSRSRATARSPRSLLLNPRSTTELACRISRPS